MKHRDYLGNFLIGVFIILILANSYQLIRAETNRTNILNEIKSLSQDNKKLQENSNRLSEDNKALSKENQALSKQNRDQVECIAQLFAKFTRDGLPIFIEDLDKCETESGNPQNSKSNPGSNNQSSNDNTKNKSKNPDNKQSTPDKKNNQPNNPQPQKKKSLVQRVVDFFRNLI